jgi:hypothetical protein
MTEAIVNPKEIIDYINNLRSNPSKFAEKLEEYIKYFEGQVMKIPEINVQISTQEGDSAFKEAVEFLKKQEPVEPLEGSRALCQIAQEILDKVVDSETGQLEEEEAEKIIDKHGTFNGRFTRAMDFAGFTSEQIVINFLVCDGDPDRTQREPLLGKELTKIGVAFGRHNIYSTVCVLVAATDFTNTRESNDKPIFPQTGKKIEFGKSKEDEKKAKLAEEERKKEEEKRKRIERMRENEEKRKAAKAKQAAGGDNLKIPKKKFFSVNNVNEEKLPEGVASMSKKDTIVIEGGKRYKKIITTKIMKDGQKVVEESKQCLD